MIAVAAVLLLAVGGGVAAWIFLAHPETNSVGQKMEPTEAELQAAFNDLAKEVPTIPATTPAAGDPAKLLDPSKLPEPPRTDSSKIDPGKTDPGKTEPNKIDPAKIAEEVKPPDPPKIPDALTPDPAVPVKARVVFEDQQANKLAALAIREFALSADGKTLAAALANNGKGALKVWDLGGTQKLTVPFDADAEAVAITPDGGTVAVIVNSAFNHDIQIFDVAAAKLLRSIKKDKLPFQMLAFSPDGKTLAAATKFDTKNAHTIRFYDSATGAHQKTLEGLIGLRSMAYTPDGKTLVTCGNAAIVNGRMAKGEVRVWDLESSTARVIVEALPGTTFKSALSADGKLVAAGYAAGKASEARLWDVASGKQLRTFDSDGKDIRTAAISPDNKLVAVADFDWKVRLFDASTGKEYGGFNAKANDMAFTPDSKSLLIHDVFSVAVWDLAAARPLPRKQGPVTKVEPKTDPKPVAKMDPPKTDPKPVAKMDPPKTDPGEPPPKPVIKPAPPGAEGQRKPVPKDDELAAAEKLVRELYKDEYAKTAAADKLALAKSLLQQAAENKEAPARYVLLREAAVLAAQAGNLSQALEAAEELAREFAVSSASMKAAVVEKAVAGVTDAKAFLEALGPVIDEAVADDDYDAGARLLRAAEAAARKSKSLALVTQVQNRAKDLDKLKAIFEKVQAAQKSLQTNADDADANLLVGRHFCFIKGDWDKGLPLLAKGSDVTLKALAQKDLAPPATAADQVAVADGWYDLAAKESYKLQLQLRASYWYKEAQPALTGLVKAKADKRLAELDKLTGAKPVADPADPLVGTWRWFSGGPLTVAGNGTFLRDGKQVGTWKLTDAAKHEYRFSWNQGPIDDVTLSSDGKLLEGKNQSGRKVSATRDEKEPVVGTWKWFDGAQYTLSADGIVLRDGKKAGAWKVTDAAKRRYRLTWSKSNWVDDLTLSADGKQLDGKNQAGKRVTGTRISD